MLLPKIDVGYSYLSEPSYIDNYQFQDYKIGLNFYFSVISSKRTRKFETGEIQNAGNRICIGLRKSTII